MSGFFGVVRDNAEPFDPAIFQFHAQRLNSRGPGTIATWTKPEAGLCFVATHTAAAGSPVEAQPANLNSREWVVGDIRLHGKKELAAQLGLNCSDLYDGSDCALLLRAWQKWGPECLPKILGDYSFALWDEDESTLWCGRDFVGARPFFYATANGAFYFSNTLRALRGLPGVSSELDPVFIGDFLLVGYCADLSRTVYRDIHRLPPAHRLKYHTGQVEVQRFLALPIEDPLYLKRPEEYLEAYLELLRQAVGDRLSKHSTALYLSGGLDSASICAIAVEQAQKQPTPAALKAFTMSWQALFEDPEPRFATITAKHLGLAHEVVEDRAVLPLEIPFSSPEPSAELFGGRLRRQNARVAEYSGVVLGGDGGDDVLTGQAWPYLRSLAARSDWTRMAGTFAGFLLSHGRLPPLRGGFRSRLRRFFRREDQLAEFPNWVSPELERKTQLRLRFRELKQPDPEVHPIHPHAYANLESHYWSSILENEDAGCTGLVLESRSPLLDPRLLCFLLRLPPVPWCVNKELVRRALKNHLPEVILGRNKTPLARDTVEAVQAERGWRPAEVKHASTSSQSFINWSSWHKTLNPAKGSISWDNLYPLALEYWLKDIENE